MTQTLKKAFEEASKLPDREQDFLANFVHDHLEVLGALREEIKSADQGEVVPIQEVEKMIPKWVS